MWVFVMNVKNPEANLHFLFRHHNNEEVTQIIGLANALLNIFLTLAELDKHTNLWLRRNTK